MGQNAIGGLIGQAQLDDEGGSMTLDIDSSSVDHNVTGTGGDIGGLIGHAFVFNSDPILMRIKITDSFVSGNVTGDGSVGGIIGGTEGMGPGVLLNNGNSTGGLILQNDYTTGDVTGNVNDDNAVGAGGLVGYLWCSSSNSANPYGCSIASSYATGNVSGYRYVGGLVGYDGNDVSIGDAYAHGNVTGNNEVGGLIGQVDPSDITSSVSRTYATGAISSVDGSGSDIGGLIGKITGGTAVVSDSFAETNMDAIDAGANIGFVIGNPAGGTKTNLWYTPTGSADLGCTGIGSDPDYCHNANNDTFFENSTTNGPLANWDFTSAPVWISHDTDYPTLTGNVYIPPAPTVSITTPADSSTVTTWSPSVDWGNATTCDYSYGDSDATNPVNCHSGGSDIPAPDTTGSQTLNIKGSNEGGSSSLVSSSFTYNPDLSTETANVSAYWKFDEANQGDAPVDSSTNGSDGTLAGSPAPAPSSDHPDLLNITPDTHSLSFNSANSDDVTVGGGSNLQMNGSFSIAFWMKPTSWNDGSSQGIISNFDTNHGYIVYDDSSDNCGGSCGSLLNFRAYGTSNTYDYLHSTATVANNIWSHWAIVYNAITHTVKIYKNGTLDTTYTGITLGDATAYDVTSLGFSQPWNGYFNGNLDDFRIYQNALTAPDVAYLAALNETNTPPATLLTPVSSYTYGDSNPLTVSFELPQDMHTGTLHLVFTPTGDAPLIDMLLRDADSGRVNTFHFTPTDLSGVDEIISSNMGSIPDGTYTVTLTYQDVNQDSPATTTATNVVIAPPSGVPVLTAVTPIASNTTAANATYSFSNTESSGAYEFTEITQSGGGTVTTHMDPVNHLVTFTGLQVGETYSTSFEFIDSDHHVSNTLDIGPFTVVAPPSGGGGGGGGGGAIWTPPAGPSSSSSGGGSGAGCAVGDKFSKTTGLACPTTTPPSNQNGQSQQQQEQVCLSTPYLNSYIKLGAKNNPDDVKKLQTYLNTYEGEHLVVDGVYKQVDVDAVKRFQTNHKDILAYWGITTPTGYVYIATQKAINAVFCQKTIPATSGGTTTTSGFQFTHTLGLGDDDPDVAQLQHFLDSHGFPVTTTGWGSLGQEATTFGKKTQIALAKYQKANSITPVTGMLGQKTMKFINAVIASGK
jgi:hypothetical protein